MLILLPVFLLLLTALSLLGLRLAQPDFKFPWMIAAGGSVAALLSVFLWQLHFPLTFSLPSWEPANLLPSSPTWLADDISWPYALALTALAAAGVWTSVVRAESNSATWAGTFLVTAMGILAVAAGNPLTLILAWTAMDLTELLSMLRSTEGENQSANVVIAFAVRLAGTGLVIWASTVSSSLSTPMDFRAVPSRAGIYLLLAAGLRLGILPLHLPYRQENVLRRGFGTSLRLVSAAASLALLSRISPSALINPLLPFLLILVTIPALYAGWMWLRAPDELLGRPFWILGMASLAVAACLRADPAGSTAWGVALILNGGVLFLFSARQRSLLVLPLLAIWGISALPFSPTATGWKTGNQTSGMLLIPYLLAEGLLVAGYFRHALQRGETSFESQARWAKVIYPTGLFLPAGIQILLGLWGWSGARTTGVWWAAVTSLIVAGGFTALALMLLDRRAPMATPTRWTEIFRLNWLYRILQSLYRFLEQIVNTITSSLEGDGGILWSLLILVLILSLLSTLGR
ncbi:MAG: hypothetical protein ABSB41_01220 [Anaerolineales bacterium]|jgi:hypothetical protein